MAASIQKLLSFTNIKNPKLILAPLKVSCVPSYRYGALVSSTGEKVTHTGQVYDEKDLRRARFVGRQKEVNENFAINLVAEEPVKEVESRVVSCDGGGGALGHPRVYINLDKDTKVGTCGYCGLQFKQTHHH
ncbi:NADH dehydrogenase [ubiquinone] iron-sulfur protein 6, mitochondrial isoform X1 [Lepisosteus oculatus]|uniref:NADH dehydrogenase [ubiquinone] iron-sulfur protein 6, mitochondrial isoform X1 n=1 Tax=Lepisosteus oculatus TaxID=7918 RepID=UPI0003EAAA75|nr:PREDICTED: NADH dehydrogenase [ubiquinone] iron-sulfur protein 6, mitochondrial [Lepisosteus oculatus]